MPQHGEYLVPSISLVAFSACPSPGTLTITLMAAIGCAPFSASSWSASVDTAIIGHVVDSRDWADDAGAPSLSPIGMQELMTLEHEGARAIWEATLAGVPWQQQAAEEMRQHALREVLAERLADEPPRAIVDLEIDAARGIAELAHRTQTDKVGAPYLEHPQRVAERVKDDDETYVVALLHDVIEDGPHHQAPGTEFIFSMSAIARDVGPR